MMTSMNVTEEIGYTDLVRIVPEKKGTLFLRERCHDDEEKMKKTLHNSSIAIVGGGRVCRAILEILLGVHFPNYHVRVLGVADIDEQAEGLLFAGEKGIFVTSLYQDLFVIRELDLIIELTGDNRVLAELRANKPDRLRLIDHFEAMTVWDYLQIEEKSIEIRDELTKMNTVEEIEKQFDHFAKEIAEIVQERTEHLQEVEKELVERERILAQIVEGNTIPTFVIDRDHIITHWNRACETLTGFPAREMVGTRKQWVPFWQKMRPVMADIIIDEMQENGIRKYYGDDWRTSALIEGAYEAEAFFPSIGDDGKWLFITAAPIRGPEGTIMGAIETLWDKTDDKKREEEKERHNRELSALCSITTALSSSLDLEVKLNAVTREIFKSLPVDGVCIFLLENGHFVLRYSHGISDALCNLNCTVAGSSIIEHVVETGALTIYEDIEASDDTEISLLAREGFKSLAYIPISAKEGKVFGVIRIGSNVSRTYTHEERNILELIGNRVGVAIENSIFYEQYKKSEEKYRSLFDNDPNPIFIIDRDSFEILDMNRRAEDCYGFSKDELLGKSFLTLGEERDEEIIRKLRQLDEGESVLFSKKRHYRKGRKVFFVNINVCHVMYNEGAALIATTTDMSESIERETQLIQASKMTTLGTMAAGMAHEINQPLNVIQVGADFFLKKTSRNEPIDYEELRTVAAEISNNVQRAADIIRHMRDFSRQSDVVSTRLNINKPIRDVFKVLGQQLRVHQIEVVLDLDDSIPLIKADHNRMEQVFMNLVTNAMDAMDEKGLMEEGNTWQRLLTIRSFYDGDVVVTVADTGIGMSAEIQDKIFEPFFTTKEVGKGTGLGISISYGIVNDYGGTITVKSEVHKGTTFELRFPSRAEKRRNRT